MLHGARILVVDDEPAVRISLSGILESQGAQVVAAGEGQQAISLLAQADFDLVLLDLRMPGLDGLRVLEAVQKICPATVSIILTAHATLDSAIGALRLGAFDYLLKPCDPHALIASLERGLKKRREFLWRQDLVNVLGQTLSALGSLDEPVVTWVPPQAAGSGNVITAGAITVDLPRRSVTVNGVSLVLSPIEFNLLVYMVRRPDHVLTCGELAQATLGHPIDERQARPIVRVHIHRLRRKLERVGGSTTRVATVRGAGYMLATDT